MILGEGPLANLFGTAAPAGASGAGAVGGLFGLLGGGNTGGGLGSLFSGFHANGGTIPSGHWGIAGEAGAEIINGPAAVTPFAQINAALNSGRASSSGGSSGAPVFHIDARGAQAGVGEEIAAALKRYHRELPQHLPGLMRTADRRYS